MNQNKNLIWQAPEFVHHPKNLFWNIIFIVVSVGLVAYAYYYENTITIITFAVLAIVGWIFAHRKPQMIKYQLTPVGAIAGQTMIPYKNIKKFWILYNPPLIKTVNFETTAYLNTEITMQLGSMEPMVVKKYLKTYLTEDLEREESMTDILARKTKF